MLQTANNAVYILEHSQFVKTETKYPLERFNLISLERVMQLHLEQKRILSFAINQIIHSLRISF